MSDAPNKLTVHFDEKQVDAIFADVNQCHLPGAVVGIAVDGKVVYRKGFGLASMDLPVMLAPSMRMRIGSTSKQFTAFTCMMLCESGLASIDDALGIFLPELHPITHRVTLRQLMGNTSGLREANDLAAQFSGVSGRRVTTDDLLSFYRDVDDANAPPGTTCIYNNGGWILLGAVIEKITGRTLEQVMWERVFLPIGMHDTLLRRWDASFVPNSASTHTWIDDQSRFERRELIGGIDYAGAGAMVSTVDDMLRWMAHMDRPTVGSPETWRTMKTPQSLANGTSTGYGLGLFTLSYRGVETLQHAGGGFGSNAQMLKVPAAGLDIIVMVNRSDKLSTEYADRIVDLCVSGLEPVRSLRKAPAASGTFQSQTSGRVASIVEREGYSVLAVDGFEMPIDFVEGGAAQTTGAYCTWKYSIALVGDTVKPSSLQLKEFGSTDELLPVPEGPVRSASGILGRYRSDTTGTDITISALGEGARMDARGRFGKSSHRLESIAPGIWASTPMDPLVVPPWGVICFLKDGQEFFFSNILNRNLRFRRLD